MKRVLPAAFGTALAFVLVGCGSPPPEYKPDETGAVLKGKVTKAGSPLGGGTVMLVSAADPTKTAQGSISFEGTYEISNAPLGKVKIGVSTDTAKMFDPAHSKGAPPYPPGVQAPKMKYVPISSRYAKPEQSGLGTEVKAGENVHEIKVN